MSEYPSREGFLQGLIAKMTGSDQLPQLEAIAKVWYEMLNDITPQGQVSRFTAAGAPHLGALSRLGMDRYVEFTMSVRDGTNSY